MTEAELRRALIAEGVPPGTVERAASATWGNGPGERYAAHRHGFDKVLLALAGSITFELPEVGPAVRLVRGQRLDLPSGALHAAVVGPAGVRCFELHLPSGALAARAAAPGAAGAGGERGTAAETGRSVGS
jgi:hypothetical protein